MGMTVRDMIAILQKVEDQDALFRVYPGAAPIVIAYYDPKMRELTAYLGPDRDPEELKVLPHSTNP